MKKKLHSLLVLLLSVVCAKAQTTGFHYYSALDAVNNSGFYKIAILPELSAHIKTDLSDIRIVNDTGKWVPHLVRIPSRYINNEGLILDLPVTENIKENSNTGIIVENLDGIISNLRLTIRNTGASRFCSLSGSDDRVKWYVINDSILVNPSASSTGTENSFPVYFPPVNFRYFRFVFYNNGKDPIDVKAISTYETMKELPGEKRIENPPAKLLQKDCAGNSYIKVIHTEPYHFDEISLKLSGVKYFNRRMDLYIPVAADHSFSNPGKLVQSFTISNNSTLQFRLNEILNAAEFYLVIRNDDNLPLKLESVNSSAEYKYLVPYLEAGKQYRLVFDDTGAKAAQYDLSAKDLPAIDSIPLLGYSSINRFEEQPLVQVKSVKGKYDKWILWGAIALVLVILLVFTRKLLKEIDKKKTV